MTDEKDILAGHLSDLAERAYRNNVFTFSAFLGLAEQSELARIRASLCVPCVLFGGMPDCERVMARFGSEEDFGYSVDFPIVCLKAAAKSAKYSDEFSHRDFLGALMNLGVERETLGDIALVDNVAFIFCEDKIAPYITENLTRVKHTDVLVTPTSDLPAGGLYRTECETFSVTSVRLDALLSRVFSLSREDGKAAVEKGLVFVNGTEVSSPALTPKEGSAVTLRGKGRFLYHGTVGTSKKGKTIVKVERFL